MRLITLSVILVLFASKTFAQNQKMIQRSWIKTSVENLSDRPVEPDSLYIRYTFDKVGLNISFYPGWDDYKQTWSVNGNKLKIDFDTYKIEALTDTTLVLFLDGFRRMKFVSEDYVSKQKQNLVYLNDYNGKALYKANQCITPRFAGKESLQNLILKKVEGYHVVKASYFLVTFVVGEDGEVGNIKIIKGITDGFNKEVENQLVKTSKNWKPAYFQGKPIQTEISYEIKYLDSIVP